MQAQNSDVLASVVQRLCEHLATPRSLSVWLCYKYNQEALVELPMPDTAVDDTSEFAKDYFVTEYLSKYVGLKLSRNLRQVALDSWRATEVLCAQTNVRLRDPNSVNNLDGAEALIFRAQRKISKVLGPLDVPRVLEDCRWGPGATQDLRKSRATLDKKILETISVTARALPYLRAVLESDIHWAGARIGTIPSGHYSMLSSNFNIVRGSRFLTVPKNAKTDRSIAAEPTGNSFLQQGVHQYMRDRLKRFGVNLDDQSINQRAARGAYHRRLSTLDLSAASDSITTELVFLLLPIDWALLLDALRSHETEVDGRWVRTEKFASMGNAFCFELETLIFWAISSSVASNQERINEISVYGDDIIVPREGYDDTVRALEFFGFKTNLKKSYKEGNFFESCGKHYHKGIDVTPVYQKAELNHPSELIRAHNRLIRLQARGVGISRACLSKLTSAYPLQPFPRVPYGVSEDGGFLRPLHEFEVDPNRGFRCHVLDYVTRIAPVNEAAVYAYKLRHRAFRNPTPSGHAGLSVEGKWRTKVRWVPELATRDESLVSQES